jgi:predicted RNA binding protein YcfA (HicA-like mRNA interferase family)
MWKGRPSLPRLPRLSGEDVCTGLRRLGLELDHIEGSHHIMRNALTRRRVTVPVRGTRVLPPKTLQSTLAQAQITAEALTAALR